MLRGPSPSFRPCSFCDLHHQAAAVSHDCPLGRHRLALAGRVRDSGPLSSDPSPDECHIRRTHPPIRIRDT
jgi:hypothetical protein